MKTRVVKLGPDGFFISQLQSPCLQSIGCVRYAQLLPCKLAPETHFIDAKPRCKEKSGGGVQHARNAAYSSRIESKDFSCAVASVSLTLLLAPALSGEGLV